MSSMKQTPTSLSSADESSSRPTPSRLGSIQTSVHDLFTGRSSVGRAKSQSPESSKTPGSMATRPILGLQNLPTPRLNVSFLSRSNSARSHQSHHSHSSQSSTAPLSPNHVPDTPLISQIITPNSSREQVEQYDVPSLPLRTRQSSRGREFHTGVDPAELALAELALDGRRRRRVKSRRLERTRRGDRSCSPKMKNKRIRSKILCCVISGLFLIMVLAIYLALALSNRNESQEFHVLLILVILITTIFFCHSLIRLCMMIIHPPAESDLEQGLPPMTGPGGYANPSTPLQVTLARDEEAAGIESDATKTPPPAYGLWRESVRVDPNRIFWQRNEEARNQIPPNIREEGGPSTVNRPPSYISENGIDYVVEAQPRSIAPTTDVPLPLHPSEVGRVWTGPTM